MQVVSRPVLTGNGPHGTLKAYDFDEHELYVTQPLPAIAPTCDTGYRTSDAALGLCQGADWYVVLDVMSESDFTRRPYFWLDATTTMDPCSQAAFDDLGSAYAWASRMASLLDLSVRVSVGSDTVYEALCLVHRDEWLASCEHDAHDGLLPG